MIGDRRLTLANARVADVALQGTVEAPRYVTPAPRQCRQPVADILDRPGPEGARDSQLLFGDPFAVIEERDGYAFGQCARDGYVGFVETAALGRLDTPTHWVAAPATQLYPDAEAKSRAETALFMGTALRVLAQKNGFGKIQTGHFVPMAHLKPFATRYADPAGVAELFLGTPYLWGGRSRWGVDCSGLIQLALEACGIDCPRDSDMQEAALGRPLAKGEPLRRGDIVFWKGHVGILTAPGMLLHANMHHMAVAQEPLLEATRRIAETDTGPVTSRRRL
ncbi:NlpC/P60 family protein [Rhodovulum sp. YNF3179]|uniref:C40 family peptidase n=1 Tax=Rhodovulum sp. YNF3179 TaxID=3425127 RepID=UPI003D352996